MRTLIYASTFAGLCKQLGQVGIIKLSSANWIRQPARVNGEWAAEVRV